MTTTTLGELRDNLLGTTSLPTTPTTPPTGTTSLNVTPDTSSHATNATPTTLLPSTHTHTHAHAHAAVTTASERKVLGSTNENPVGLSFAALLLEDFRTHDKSFVQPGLYAIWVHRFGNWRMSFRSRAIRAPLTLLYHVLYTLVTWVWGIDVGYTVPLGRRVRIWHHGGIVIGAKRIGDDVHIRQNTTLGVLNRNELDKKPTIGDRVDIGAGACILGDVKVGNDVVVGANSVVVKDVPNGAVMFGVPARPVKLL